MNLLKQKTVCLVFRTNLQNAEEVKRISETMDSLPGIVDWSVDLEDWEKVLRVEGTGIQKQTVLKTLQNLGVDIRELPL